MTGVCVAQMDPWAQSFVIRGARVRLRRDKGGNSLVSHCMAQTLTPCTKYLHLWFMTLDMLWPLQYAQVSAYHPTSYFQLSIPLWPRRAPPSVSPRTSSPSQPSHATNRSHSIQIYILAILILFSQFICVTECCCCVDPICQIWHQADPAGLDSPLLCC